jgi:hypothetical protein
MPRVCLILGLIFFSVFANAYPQFIGYKYSSCLTCHYNSQGNGPINDYGRALWSAEIAGRLWSGKKTEEQLSETSGFLGKTPLPWWIRPGIKVRQLWIQTNPGGANSSNRDILMQADANVALFLDKNQKYTVVASYGYVPEPLRLQNQINGEEVDEFISREHYFRWQAKDDLWMYFGMMDKVYGIRIVNHTAYSRARTGLAQNDQSHGVIAHYIKQDWELTGNIFLGNLFQDAELRQKGASALFEYEMKEAWRLGASVLMSSNDFIKNQRMAVHSRVGYGHGSSILFEMGLIQDSPESGTSRKGYYMYSEAMQKIVRGYHLFVTGQAYKDDLVGSRPDNLRLGAGLLMFPMARTEFRVEVENTRQILPNAEVPKDFWAVMAQIHLSL